MATIYTMTNHPLLMNKVKALDTPEFEANVLLAETLLKLPTSPWTGRDAEQAMQAIALQMNWQVEWKMDPYALASEFARIQGESKKYKPDVPVVNPQAAKILEPVLAAKGLGPFRTLRSIRGPNL